jgi:hypothetical protein
MACSVKSSAERHTKNRLKEKRERNRRQSVGVEKRRASLRNARGWRVRELAGLHSDADRHSFSVGRYHCELGQKGAALPLAEGDQESTAGRDFGRRGGSTRKGDCRSSCDTVRTWRAKPFLFATGLEQQAPHSPFRADHRRGHREEDETEG